MGAAAGVQWPDFLLIGQSGDRFALYSGRFLNASMLNLRDHHLGACLSSGLQL
jgi:hypothetical protein